MRKLSFALGAHQEARRFFHWKASEGCCRNDCCLDYGFICCLASQVCQYSFETKHRCDSKNLDGTDKSPEEIRKGYTHAQKMRAAATFGFGRLLGKGRTPWAVSEVTGEMVGNPSVSEMVSCYMVSLRRCKVCLWVSNSLLASQNLIIGSIRWRANQCPSNYSSNNHYFLNCCLSNTLFPGGHWKAVGFQPL